MNKTVITLAAALLLGTSWAAFAQEDPTLVVPDGQPGASQQGDQQPQKKRKKREAEQPSADQQSEQPQPEKKRRKKQAEQPDDAQQQPSNDQQFEQPKPEKKRKKQAQQPDDSLQQPSSEQQFEQPKPEKKRKKQAQQPDDSLQQPASEQQVEQPQPEKKRKKKQQAEQPTEPVQQPVEDQLQQQPEPVKKKKKKQAEEPAPQPGEQQVEQPAQQPTDQQVEQPQPEKKKKRKEQAEQPVETQPSTPEQTTGEPKSGKPAATGVPPEVTQYLSDTRPASELSDAELAERVKAGRGLVRMKDLPDDVRQDLAGKAKQARTEAIAREQGKAGGKAGQPPAGQLPTAEQPSGEQPTTGEAQKGEQGQEVVPSDQAGQPPVTLDKKDVEKFDNNKSTPQAEAKAKAYLDDTRPADRLKDDEAKTRLDGMRDLLSDNELSRDTKRELRRKLKEERDAYRNRVAEKVVVEEKKDDQKDGMPRRRDRNNDGKWDNWSERDILRDRRRSDELEEGELRRRIDIYREAIYNDRYSDDERRYWRDMMDRDRRYLGDRMRRDRGDRERYWRDRRDRNEINIDINIVLGPDREPPPSAFMDEIDDEELEDYLVAAPRRKPPRRYTVAEIEEEPDVRTAMPAIEIDNIHFGFNESFLREEEVQNLDRIAEVVEKILAGHPDEVFMIEGHTDAVGSDAYNLKLSRERAQAVKKALTTYYVIPARNLVTAGYGERYLKIPTAEPEEENRRVSFRRVTPLVGEAE